MYVIMLYKIASSQKGSRIRNTIQYRSYKELAETINKSIEEYNISISQSTIQRIVNNTNYKEMFSVDSLNKRIMLNNNAKKINKFVVITDKEVSLIYSVNEKLFAKYLLYLKYYCGYSKSKSVDTTAKQFLAASGYSEKSNSMVSKISEYNKILQEQQVLNIQKYRDNEGHERNVYTFK